MIFACGALALVSVLFSAMNSEWVKGVAGSHGMALWLNLVLFKLAAVPLSILSLFLVYWLLPNRRMRPGRVAPVAIFVGLILEGMKYVNLALAPWMEAKFDNEYFIFKHSVRILILSFLAALIVLAGAEWTARQDTEDPLS
jgi:membrane protein/epoxyqueuosine reductase